jgi:hypothetical protein
LDESSGGAPLFFYKKSVNTGGFELTGTVRFGRIKKSDRPVGRENGG